MEKTGHSESFEGFPFIMGWELTLACNLKCAHCASSAGLPRDHELSTDEALQICDQFPDLVVQEVNFTGGEPLLRKDWPKIAARIHAKDIRVKMVSNGTCLDRDTATAIRDSEISRIAVSFDGFEATHDRLRGQKGLFQKVIEGVKLLQKAEIPVSAITTVNAWNMHHLFDFGLFLAGCGITHWQVQPVFPTGRARSSPSLTLTEHMYREIGRFLREDVPVLAEKGLVIQAGDSVGYYASWDTRYPPWKGCNAGIVSCGIMSNGKVKGCLSLPDSFVEGDLRIRNLWDIWFDSSSFSYSRKRHRDDAGPNCESCPKWEDCGGGCTAMSVGTTGRPRNDPYCFLRLEGHEEP